MKIKKIVLSEDCLGYEVSEDLLQKIYNFCGDRSNEIEREEIKGKTDKEKELELMQTIIETKEMLKIARSNFEYAEDDLIDYYTYQIKAHQSKLDYLIKIAKTPRKYVLTDALLETLSIIAYKQPVTKVEIDKIRGVSCEHSVNRLLDFELITEVGRLDAPGRPILFGTTEQFLRSFGVKSLTELPELNPDRIAQFREEAEKEIQLTLDI